MSSHQRELLPGGSLFNVIALTYVWQDVDLHDALDCSYEKKTKTNTGIFEDKIFMKKELEASLLLFTLQKRNWQTLAEDWYCIDCAAQGQTCGQTTVNRSQVML